MTFNPNDYIINLQGKKYLQVTHRVIWYRETYPAGAITTDLVATEPLPIVKAYVTNNEGVVIATGFGTAKVKEKAVWNGREIEKAETAAIGRALALAGFGTQFANEYDDTDHLSDSPQSTGKTTISNVPESKGKLSERGNSKRPTFVANPDMWDKMLAFIRTEGLDDFDLLEALNLPDLNAVQSLPCDDTGRAEIKAKIASFKAQAVQS